MKYYIIAGEASGDLHGSNLIRELKMKDKEANFRLWGGALMEKEGGDLIRHYRDLAFMGFVEVVKNLKKIKRNLNFCKQDIVSYSPDVLILIDYPGFNLRIAQFGKENGFKIFYYISPKVWAWKEKRVHKIVKFVDRMFSILPFEVDYFKKFNYQVVYEGNPVVDAISGAERTMTSREHFFSMNQLPNKPLIALIPGSRKQEIYYNLPVMLKIIKFYPDHQFVLACSDLIDNRYYAKFTHGHNVKLLYNQTYSVMKYADAALITSGTATLEAALLKVPQVVCYKANIIGMFIAFLLVNLKHISLVNLIMGKEVVKELLQYKVSPALLKREVDKLLFDKQARLTLQDDYTKLTFRVGKPGVSERVANRMFDLLSEQSPNL